MPDGRHCSGAGMLAQHKGRYVARRIGLPGLNCVLKRNDPATRRYQKSYPPILIHRCLPALERNPIRSNLYHEDEVRQCQQLPTSSELRYACSSTIMTRRISCPVSGLQSANSHRGR
jgi:hypothetical protein